MKHLIEKEKTMKISGKELFVHSPNKMGRYMDSVKSGCGAHKDKSKYTRKTKHRNKKYD